MLNSPSQQKFQIVPLIGMTKGEELEVTPKLGGYDELE
jgi:hypothetical protein